MSKIKMLILIIAFFLSAPQSFAQDQMSKSCKEKAIKIASAVILNLDATEIPQDIENLVTVKNTQTGPVDINRRLVEVPYRLHGEKARLDIEMWDHDSFCDFLSMKNYSAG